jgi:hypothetical protein
MSDKKIPYVSRNFDDYRKSFLEMVKTYYPDMANDFNDASIGSWIIDLVAAASDNLSYHIDRVFNETSIDAAQQRSSLYAIARSSGLKIPGPKCSMVELVFSCTVSTDFEYDQLPTIKRGTTVTSGRSLFEITEDVEFSKQYNNDGISDRNQIPLYNSNNELVGYRFTKRTIATSGRAATYEHNIYAEDRKPFMEIVLPINGITNIESIITKPNTNQRLSPTDAEWFMKGEQCGDVERFYEVDSLLEQYIWDEPEVENNVENVEIPIGDDNTMTIARIQKGAWKPIRNKFITEYTDKGYLKVIFGCDDGSNEERNEDSFTNKQLHRMINNKSMGKIPKKDHKLYIRYRLGGGAESNVAANALNTINNLNVVGGNNSINDTITVTNPEPSISGRDMLSTDELRNYIKYHNAAQNRCVTVKDYEDRVLKMPAKYGCPFRVIGIEENNKIMLYVINIDENGKLSKRIPKMLADNMINYLSMYRTVNDYITIKEARIINIGFEVDIVVDKNYNAPDVISSVIRAVKEYMDINKRYLGEDIYIGDLNRVISNVDGVLNLIELRAYNKFGGMGTYSYSGDRATQEVVSSDDSERGQSGEFIEQIDLRVSNNTLISDADCIFEVKYPDVDICVQMKQK